MFHASVNDEAYDPARWGQFYKPAGGGNWNNNSTPTPSAPAAPSAPVAEAPAVDAFAALQRSAPAPVAEAAPAARPAGTPDASEILRRIKEKQANLGN